MEIKDNSYCQLDEFWYPLDNAAKIFPAVINDERTSVFRISVVLKKPINIKKLYTSVNAIEHRFPYYKVKLKKGFFWYYLESAKMTIPVEPDLNIPCRSFDPKGGMFRILVVKNKLSIEFSHILADGGGAFEFFKTLMAQYFTLCGVEIPSTFEYIKPGTNVQAQEFEDAYNRYFIENIPTNSKQSKSYHLPFALNNKPRFDVLTAFMSASELKAACSKKGVNITVYLTAVYLNSLQEIFEESVANKKKLRHKKLSIQVPINLRNLYPSKTMRNFSLFVMPEIDLRLGHYTFDEILKTVHHQMQLETEEKLINKILSRNVGSERKILIRSIPLFIKSFVLRMNYYSMGSSQYCGVITNLGRIVLPPIMEEQIEYFSVIAPPPNKKIKINCGIIGFGDKMVLTFGNISKSKELEKRFLQFLVKQDINIEIKSQNIKNERV